MRKVAVSSIVSLFVLSCSVPVANNSTQDGRMPHRDLRWSQYAPTSHPSLVQDNFSDLEREYKSFSTKALSDAYVKRMFGKYLNPVNQTQLTRQLEFSRYLKLQNDLSYETSLKSMFTQTSSLYDTMTGASAPGIQNKMSSESATFGNYVIGLSPYPGIPFATSATNIASTSFTANWGTVSGATGYKLFVEGSEVYSGSSTSFSITGLTTGATYNYYVKAFNNAGNSGSSNTVSVVLNPAIPSIPTTNVASNIAQTSFTANWNTVSGATSYKLKVDSGVYTDVGNVTSYNVTGLTAGTTHTYSVQAVNISGTSAGSSNRSVSLLPATPSAPVAKIASSVTATSFTANWDSVSGATGYILFIDGVQVYSGSALSYTKSPVVSGSTHTYYVQATNTGGTSGNSNEISVSLITNLTEVQSITTNGVRDLESFIMGSDMYLAIANFAGLTSVIYKWDTAINQFNLFQSISTNGGIDFEYFTIGTDKYLSVVSYHSTITEIYKWNGTQFAKIQTISEGLYNFDSKMFSIGTDTYLGISNHTDGGTVDVNNSKIYKWNSTSGQFEFIQNIPTLGATEMESFVIGADTYLAAANFYDSTSGIYKWNGTQFNKIQDITISGNIDIEYFKIDSVNYLMFSSFNSSSSTIYTWNGTQFVTLQTFSMNISNANFFTVGSDSYLALAKNSSTSSEIYKWNGSNFSLFQSLSSSIAYDLEPFTIGTKKYLALANNNNDSSYSSKIYRMD